MKGINEKPKRKVCFSRAFVALFLGLAIIGFIGLSIFFYKVSSYLIEKEKQESYSRGYYYGYEHARLKFDNPQPKMKRE